MKHKIAIALTVTVMVASFGLTALADHSWGGYHWARTSNPFTLKIGDNVSTTWDSVLATTASDWSQSTVLDATVVTGKAKGSCRPTKGRVEVCNNNYGNNGWLGIAQVWVSGKHITQGTVKLNDTYFNTPTYNTTAWRNLVSCQEVGHTLGLDHQDEIFDNPNLDTCMDYTNNPESNQHPNAHDYEELALIYAHLDSTTTVGANVPSGNGADVNLDNPSDWGKGLRQDSHGKDNVFGRDLGRDNKVFTFVIWAE